MGQGKNRLPYKDENLDYRSLDSTSKERKQALFAETGAQVVVHCHTISKPDECERRKEAALMANASGTNNLLGTSLE